MVALTVDKKRVITRSQLGTFRQEYPVAFFFRPRDIEKVGDMFTDIGFSRIIDYEADLAFQDRKPLIKEVNGLSGRIHITIYRDGVCAVHADKNILLLHKEDERLTEQTMTLIREDWLPSLATFEWRIDEPFQTDGGHEPEFL